MNSKVFSQLDSRWASKGYPRRGSSVGGNACGLFAVLHVAIEQKSKANWMPTALLSYMINKGYAVYGQGTTWNGITETLKYIGHKSVVRVWNDPMSSAFKELNKGNRIGVLLFNNNYAPNGMLWTASGHYVAFTDYKVEGGKHYFYCKDSGGRRNTGWYSYENSMRNCLPKIWIVERIQEKAYKPTKPYKGNLPKGKVYKGSKGADVKAVQAFLNWSINAKLVEDSIAGAKTVKAITDFEKAYGLVADGVFGALNLAKAKELVKAHADKKVVAKPTLTAGEKATAWAIEIAKGGKYKYKKWVQKDKKTHQCPICNKLTGKYKGWNCIGFVVASYYHGAGLRTFKCNCAGFGDNNFFTKVTQASWRKANGSRWSMIGSGSKGGKSLTASQLQKGDVLICYDSKGIYKHMAMYIGNGQYVDSASSSAKPNIGIRTYSKLAKNYHVTRAFRYK